MDCDVDPFPLTSSANTMSSTLQQPSRVGEQLGNLRLVRLIGAGGMAAVYEARHVILGGRQAVKLLHPERARDPQACNRFLKEAKIAASLTSEHVVPVREFGNANDGTPYLVMDFLDGEDLGTIIAHEAPLQASRAVDLMQQVCRGLRVAHEHQPGIVHRDLKPENLFVCQRDDGTELLKILDFGIAKLLESIDSTTRTGSVIGTPHYMSPEQAEGAKTVDQQTDIYAVGAILYEALSGRKAHPGNSYTEIFKHVLMDTPTPLELLRGDLPPTLLDIVRRAMETDPSKRFQSAAQLTEALTRFQTTNIHPTRLTIGIRTARSPQDAVASTLDSESESAASGSPTIDAQEVAIPLPAPTSRPDHGKSKVLGSRWCRNLTMSAAVVAIGLLVLWHLTEERRLPPPEPPIGIGGSALAPALSVRAAVSGQLEPESGAAAGHVAAAKTASSPPKALKKLSHGIGNIRSGAHGGSSPMREGPSSGEVTPRRNQTPLD